MELPKLIAVAVLALSLTACKRKDEPAKQTPAPAPAPAATTDPVGPVPAKPADSPAPPPTELLTGKLPAHGCVAYSSKLDALACVTGSTSNDNQTYTLEQLGLDAAPMPLGALDAKAAADADAALVKGEYWPLAAGQALVDRKPVDIGTLAIVWQREQTSAGGDNQPPTHANVVTAHCNGADVELLRDETEGDDPVVTLHRLAGHVAVEMLVRYFREGEHGEQFAAARIDPATCQVQRTR